MKAVPIVVTPTVSIFDDLTDCFLGLIAQSLNGMYPGFVPHAPDGTKAMPGSISKLLPSDESFIQGEFDLTRTLSTREYLPPATPCIAPTTSPAWETGLTSRLPTSTSCQGESRAAPAAISKIQSQESLAYGNTISCFLIFRWDLMRSFPSRSNATLVRGYDLLAV